MSAVAATPKVSVTTGVPFARYCEIDAINSSSLRDILVSPRLYDFRRTHRREDTDAFRVGRAGHTAILEPDRLLLEYAVFDGPRRSGKEWLAFRAVNQRKTPLTEKQYALTLAMRNAVREHPVASAILADKSGRAEVTLEWTHQRTGLRCKARPDWLGAVLADVKSCRSPDPARFASDAARYGYAFQLAFYLDGVCAVTGEMPAAKIIAVQNCEPYDVVVFDVDEKTQAIGREQVERAFDLLIECRAKNEWPGIAPREEVQLRLPAWAAVESDEELTINGESLF